MEKWHVAVLLLVGLGLLVLSVLVRVRYGERFELKTIDFVLSIIPLIFVLLITEKMKVLDAFGVKADLSELFADAADANIEQQVVDTSSPGLDEVVNMLEMAAKAGVQEIPQLVEKRPKPWCFGLGMGGTMARRSSNTLMPVCKFLSPIFNCPESGGEVIWHLRCVGSCSIFSCRR